MKISSRYWAVMSLVSRFAKLDDDTLLLLVFLCRKKGKWRGSATDMSKAVSSFAARSSVGRVLARDGITPVMIGSKFRKSGFVFDSLFERVNKLSRGRCVYCFDGVADVGRLRLCRIALDVEIMRRKRRGFDPFPECLNLIA